MTFILQRFRKFYAWENYSFQSLLQSQLQILISNLHQTHLNMHIWEQVGNIDEYGLSKFLQCHMNI